MSRKVIHSECFAGEGGYYLASHKLVNSLLCNDIYSQDIVNFAEQNLDKKVDFCNNLQNKISIFSHTTQVGGSV